MRNKIKQIKEMYKESGYYKQFLILFMVIVGTAILDIMIIPYITRQIIDVNIPERNIKALIVSGIFYIFYLLISCYLTLIHCDMRFILERKIQRDLREKIFNKMQNVKTKFYDENDTGLILQFLKSDVNDAGQLFAKVITEMVFMGIVRFTIYSIFLMFVDLRITLIILVLYIIGYLFTIYFNKKTISLINDIRQKNIEIYSKVNEAIQGFLTIKILNIIEKKEKELEKLLEEYKIANSKLEKNVSIYNNLFKFTISLSIAIIIYFLGLRVTSGVITYIELMLLIQFNNSLDFEFKWIIKHLTNFNKSFISFSKILNFLKLDYTEDIKRGEILENINLIEFSNVQFSYTGYDENVKNLNFILKKGEKFALVGRTGSGKTTIVNLLCRFYEPTKGKIKINNEDYLKYSISSLREKIGYVMQDVYIIDGTIADNIRYVNKYITDEEIKNIFKKLRIHEKIGKLKDGYDTNISNNTDILSTGEKQMINFARIMAINCDVVILDEVTSALTCETEILVNNAIKEITKNKIVITIAHRLSTIKNCDKILLLEDGTVIEEGNYYELMSMKGEYYKLFNS